VRAAKDIEGAARLLSCSMLMGVVMSGRRWSREKMEMEKEKERRYSHFTIWHELVWEVVGYDDRSEFESGNDDLVEYWMLAYTPDDPGRMRTKGVRGVVRVGERTRRTRKTYLEQNQSCTWYPIRCPDPHHLRSYVPPS
jgi:hypothetical protein